MGEHADDWFDMALDEEGWDTCEKHKCKYNPKWPCPICEDEWGNGEDYIRLDGEPDLL